MNLVNLFIDDQQVSVPAGTLVVDAAKSVGITIPVFCYHPKLKPVGMCRMCLVEIGTPAIDRATGQPVLDESGQQKIVWNLKLQTACTTPVSEGMQVRTAAQSDAVKAAQREVLELLLTSHPLDCPICDKGGECPLQNLTMAYGPGKTRFEFLDKQLLDKHVPLGDLIWLDRERCIQCARCVRFQDEIAGDHVLGFSERGRKLEIITFSAPPFNSHFSGNTTDICPVGALTTVDFHFRARPWELTNIPSLCPHCAVGCNLTLSTRRSAKRGGGWEILRVMPRQNEQVNEIWICDKGRFGHGHTHSPQRLTQPLVRWGESLQPISWDAALAVVSEKLRLESGKTVALVGDCLPNEDVYLLGKLLRQGFKSDWMQMYPCVGGAQVARQYGVATGTNLGRLDPANSVVLIVGADLKEEAPVWNLRLRSIPKFQVSSFRPKNSTQPAQVTCLQCREGTETHVVLGLLNVTLNVILERHQASDRNLVSGLAELEAKLAEFTPARVSELTGVPPEAIVSTARALAAAGNTIFAFGTVGAPESLPQHLANLAVLTGHVGRPNNGLLPVWPHANTQGVLDQITTLGFQTPDFGFEPSTLYIAGADPVGDGAELPPSAFVICQELFATETARKADVVLPAVSWAERDGTFTNAERRVQRFYKALPSLGQAQPDWQIMQRVARKLGLDWNYATSEEIMVELAATMPGYAQATYARLAQVAPQWPPVGYDDLYFGGTVYDNRDGLGVQLSAGCESAERYELRWVEPQVAPIKARPLYRRGTLVEKSERLKAHLVDR